MRSCATRAISFDRSVSAVTRVSTIWVVLDMEGAGRHSIYTLYNPFRLVIDWSAAAHSGQGRGGSGR